MRLSLFALALTIAAYIGAPSAQARPYYTPDGQSYEGNSINGQSARRQGWSGRETSSRRQRYRQGYRQGYRTSARSSGLGSRPARWCGWWMRTQLGGGPEFNRAVHWKRWGRPTSGPQIGAVVVWPHHVGMITGRTASGQWIVKSGNDGGRVRERARSVSGAVFRVG